MHGGTGETPCKVARAGNCYVLGVAPGPGPTISAKCLLHHPWRVQPRILAAAWRQGCFFVWRHLFLASWWQRPGERAACSSLAVPLAVTKHTGCYRVCGFREANGFQGREQTRAGYPLCLALSSSQTHFCLFVPKCFFQSPKHLFLPCWSRKGKRLIHIKPSDKLPGNPRRPDHREKLPNQGKNLVRSGYWISCYFCKFYYFFIL